MFIYLIIYLPFVLSAYLDFNNKANVVNKKTIAWIFVLVFTLFRGLRWNTGTDWDQFLEVYQHSHWDNIFSYSRNETEQLMDYGYMFINAFFHESGLSYTTFLLVTNFWIMWCYMDFSFRHSKYPLLTLILIMSMGIPFPVRQTIAFATSLWGYRFVVERKWFVYLIVATVSATIHKGSLIGIFVILIPYMLSKCHIKWWGYAILYGSSFILGKILSDYISFFLMLIAGTDGQLGVYSEAYMKNQSTSVDYGDYNVSMLNGLGYTFFFIALLWIREKYNNECNKKIKSFEFFFFLYALVASIDNMVRQGDQSGMTEVLGRVMSTLDMFPVIFPLIFTILLPRYFKGRMMCFLVFFVYMIYKFWQQIPGSFYYDLFIPYKSILSI